MLKDSVLEQSVEVVVREGLAGWSLDEVARRVRCAKGLILYHYRSKAELLGLTAGQMERVRWERRFAALAGGEPGLGAIDRLWIAMVEDVDTGGFRGWISLYAAGYAGTGSGRGDEFRAAAAEALGLPTEALADSASIEAMLEGMELLLSRGASRDGLRTGYHRSWASMLAP